MAVLIQYANGVPAIKFVLDQESLSIGRGEDNDICVADPYASKQHACIEVLHTEDGVKFLIRDLQSTNHTYVNNEVVTEAQLSDGDAVKIGKSRFSFATDPQETHKRQEQEASSICQEFPDAMTLREEQFNKSFSRRLTLV